MTAPALPEGTGALIALASLSGVGPATVLRCLDDPGPEAAWASVVAGAPGRSPALAAAVARMTPAAIAHLVRTARSLDPSHELARHLADGRRVLVRGGAGYPERLRDDPSPAALLFAEGDLAAWSGPTVAIVGTRNATRPGRELAAELAADLAAVGVAVVSGLALGIDGAAHEGALRAGAADRVDGGLRPGVPIGIIASGLDVAYPRRHARLHRSVVEHGLLLSETPLGQRPTAWRFPARNRLIAGLADAVVVVESRSAGGSMLTVSEALARGVPVLAVPGHPSAPAAAGTNDLLFDGAAIVRTARDVLDAIGLDVPAPPGPVDHRSPAASHRTEVQRAVLDAIGLTPAALPEVVARSRRGLEEVAEALAQLEAAGDVVRSSGWYERAGAPPRRGDDGS